jgi:small GTP-binding protein
MQSAKVTFLGDAGVGKTSIVRAYKNESIETLPTVSAEQLLIALPNRSVPLSIWDAPGRSVFESVIPIYIRGAVIVVVVFDLSDETTFESVGKWIEIARNVQDDCTIVIVGNKTDLEEARISLPDIGERYNAPYIGLCMVTSAKMRYGIDLLFEKMTDIAEATVGKEEVDQEPLILRTTPEEGAAQPCQC